VKLRAYDAYMYKNGYVLFDFFLIKHYYIHLSVEVLVKGISAYQRPRGRKGKNSHGCKTLQLMRNDLVHHIILFHFHSIPTIDSTLWYKVTPCI
jgi:hypothetical protein